VAHYTVIQATNWIAFNAAYASEIDEQQRLSEQEPPRKALLAGQEQTHRRTGLARVLRQYPRIAGQPLRIPELLRSPERQDRREHLFASGKRAAQLALASGNTPVLLVVLFNCFYTPGNQLVHGGATWSGSVNREQMRDCTNLLGKLVPLIIELMMDSADTLWGDACYPVVG